MATETPTRSRCRHCGDIILQRSSDGVWFSQGISVPVTRDCGESEDGLHAPAATPTLPTFEEMRRNAYRAVNDALDELRSDWKSGTGPTHRQAELLREARAGLLRAKKALDEAGR